MQMCGGSTDGELQEGRTRKISFLDVMDAFLLGDAGWREQEIADRMSKILKTEFVQSLFLCIFRHL